MEKQKVLQNAVSNRILQVLYLHEALTTTEIKEKLSDIPQATLYRYMKYLEEYQIIHVVGRNKVYGQTEKLYAVRQLSIEESPSSEEAMFSVDMFLKEIRGKYDRYFIQTDNNSPMEDLLFMTKVAFCLSDKEFCEMKDEVKAVLGKYIGRECTPERKQRNLYLLSTPEEEE